MSAPSGSSAPIVLFAVIVVASLIGVCVVQRTTRMQIASTGEPPKPPTTAAAESTTAAAAPTFGKVPTAVDPAFAEAGAIVRKHRSKFAACQEKALKVDPSARGDVRVRIIVSDKGKVMNVETVETTASTALTDCTKSVFAALRFPDGGGTFTFPVHYGN